MKMARLTIGLFSLFFLVGYAFGQGAQIPAPNINLSGNIGCQGFPCHNNGILTLNSDANHTMTPQETSAAQINVQSSVSLTSTRNLVYPAGRFHVTVENLTTGGQSIQVIGQSGTGVTIPNGKTVSVWNDGTNFVLVGISGGGGGYPPNAPDYSLQASGAGQTSFTSDPAISINTTNHTLNVGSLPANHVSIGALGTPTSWNFDTTSAATALASLGGGGGGGGLSGMTAGQVPVAATASTVTSSVAASTTVNGVPCALGSTCTITSGSGTVSSGTAGYFGQYLTTGTTVGQSTKLDDGHTTANTLTYTGTNGFTAPILRATGGTAGIQTGVFQLNTVTIPGCATLDASGFLSSTGTACAATAGVTGINTLTGPVVLAAGSNVALTTVGNQITINGLVNAPTQTEYTPLGGGRAIGTVYQNLTNRLLFVTVTFINPSASAYGTAYAYSDATASPIQYAGACNVPARTSTDAIDCSFTMAVLPNNYYLVEIGGSLTSYVTWIESQP